ncbi:MAG: tetratricopeptide repeat protein [Proteobacteria bacterium]|nr:tetratricopeptide repeat protein [Pseudomonadota bacterium]
MDITSQSPYFIGIILVLIGFFAGFVLSDIFSSRKKKAADKSTQSGGTAYLKGINYILANEPDRAIEEFSKAVQINSDTVETYIALGNLFRSKGEVGRAIRIHQGIILRPHIDIKTKIQAYYDLSLDFKKAGFVNRAIESFEKVLEMDNKHLDSHVQLLELYEDIRDWEKSYQTQQAISKLRKSNDYNVLAHHQTELAKTLIEQGLSSQAKKCFKKAISLDKMCSDAYLHLGDLFYDEGSYAKAIDTWKEMMQISPGFTYLAYPRLEEAFFKLNEFGKIEDILRENSRKNYNDIHTHLALAEYLYKKSQLNDAIGELKTVLTLKPSHIQARQALGKYLMELGREAEAVAVHQELLHNFPFPEKNYQCNECGYESNELLWRCPQCRRWDTIDEKPLPGEKEK